MMVRINTLYGIEDLEQAQKSTTHDQLAFILNYAAHVGELASLIGRKNM